MNKLSVERQARVLRALVEGNSIRSTVCMTGVAENTTVELLVEVGAACSDYQDKAPRNLPCRRLQCDEIWSFVHAKEKNVPDDLKRQFGYGDVWTWTAIDADTKLVPSWLVGNRDVEHSKEFMDDVAGRLAPQVQLHHRWPQVVPRGHRGRFLGLRQMEGATVGKLRRAFLVK